MEVELDGTTDIAPRPSIDSIPLPFADASGGSGCREVTKAYNVMKMVGKGTYGEVSKAQLKGSNADAVALKKLIFDKKSYQSGGFPVTAIREIAILKRLKHENIVDLRELPRRDGGFSMVLGYMDYDLAGLLERGIRFSVAEVLCISKQMFTGLHFIHHHEVMHRDMKSANILLDRRGTLRITDFGLARPFSVDSRYTDKQICTRWYRPPEILLGLARYTPSIDVWGAGCIVAELFIGKAILQGDDKGSIESSDIEQYLKICELCGTPTASSWPSMNTLKDAATFTPKVKYDKTLHTKFWGQMEFEYKSYFRPPRPGSDVAIQQLKDVRDVLLEFLGELLIMNPDSRLTSRDALLHRIFFLETVRPCDKSDLPLPKEPCHDYNEKSKKRQQAGRRKMGWSADRDLGGGYGGSDAKRLKRENRGSKSQQRRGSNH